MLVKSIRVCNFRQFKGEQRLDFAIGDENNVTIVMGDNGTGKTSLAQAFKWCLYGDTDFRDKSVFCQAVKQEMSQNTEEDVEVQLVLEHKGNQYTVRRRQRVRKEYGGRLKENASELSIGRKTPDGQTKQVEHPDLCVKEILPKALSRYFFFDGERIEKMRGEIGKGKSKEFPEAVRSLLGLDAMKEAIDHLEKVIRNYEKDYDSTGNVRMRDYNRKICELNNRLEVIEKELKTLATEEESTENRCIELRQRIIQNKASEEWAKQKEQLEIIRDKLIQQRDNALSQLLSLFNNFSMDFFAVPWMQEAMKILKHTNKMDKGIPDIHARTLDYLLKRKACLCGCELVKGSAAYEAIEELRNFIPPKSIGTAVDGFAKECNLRIRNTGTFFNRIQDYYSIVRNHEKTYGDNEDAIKALEEKLKGCENVGHLQVDLNKLQQWLFQCRTKRERLIHEQGSSSKDKERQETERSELALKDKANRRIETFKAYTQEMLCTLNDTYSKKEAEIREKLEKTVDTIFRRIYNGGFSLELDEKYNIAINVVDTEGWRGDTEVDTSAGQDASICFAFIAGVIKLARGNGGGEKEDLISEAYPLVLDAPFSVFDTTRIQTVCDELPRAAKQLIVFIKDTDGELAEKHLGKKVGKRYTFDKRSEFVTILREGK